MAFSRRAIDHEPGYKLVSLDLQRLHNRSEQEFKVAIMILKFSIAPSSRRLLAVHSFRLSNANIPLFGRAGISFVSAMMHCGMSRLTLFNIQDCHD